MQVVIHQHVAMDRYGMLPGGLEQQMQHVAPISVGCKNRLPIVAALNHMVGMACDAQAGKTCHCGSLTQINCDLTPINRDPN